MQEVKIASAPFLLVRIPSLRIQTSRRPEVFEANLKTETELWNLVVKEMWAGRKMADQHKVHLVWAKFGLTWPFDFSLKKDVMSMMNINL